MRPIEDKNMRPITVQIATAENHRIGTVATEGPEFLRYTAIKVLRGHNLGPLSLTAGLAIFDDTVEAELSVTIHEGSPHRALEVWHRLRGIPGVECGRIYDRGLSWCAKSYENIHGKGFSNGSYRWPDHTFDPVKVTA
jgi:hypothetical protein